MIDENEEDPNDLRVLVLCNPAGERKEDIPNEWYNLMETFFPYINPNEDEREPEPGMDDELPCIPGVYSIAGVDYQLHVDVVNIPAVGRQYAGYGASESDQARAVVMQISEWIRCCCRWNGRRFDIMVAGQTPPVEKVIRSVRKQSEINPGLVIRFSMYYGDPLVPYPGCLSPHDAGYSLDVFKDWHGLWQLLRTKQIYDASRGGSLVALVKELNEALFPGSPPLIIL